MKLLLSFLLTTGLFTASLAQEKNFIDQPYIETSAKTDTSVTPDRIYITITLNEADSKNKISTEEMEKTLDETLKKLNIDTKKDLSLLDYSSDFKKSILKGQNILKSKNYSLRVNNAYTAGRVLQELENSGISNVELDRAEYSKADSLLRELKYRAVAKARQNAVKMTDAIKQKVGRAIYISDTQSLGTALQGRAAGVQIRGLSTGYGSRATEPILIDIKQITFSSEVNVKFILE